MNTENQQQQSQDDLINPEGASSDMTGPPPTASLLSHEVARDRPDSANHDPFSDQQIVEETKEEVKQQIDSKDSKMASST